MDDLKKKARAAGIWNMFLPKNHFKDGPQFTNVEYGLMAEQLGKSITASEVRVSSTWWMSRKVGLGLFMIG
jgi:acyl-CoA dehydrogenase